MIRWYFKIRIRCISEFLGQLIISQWIQHMESFGRENVKLFKIILKILITTTGVDKSLKRTFYFPQPLGKMRGKGTVDGGCLVAGGEDKRCCHSRVICILSSWQLF